MKLHFATSNSNKFRELSKLLKYKLIPVPLELQEIQTTNLHELLKYKLKSAYEEIHAPVIVEDTSLYFNAWNELPGPLIKWFLSGMGLDGITKALSAFEDKSAQLVCCLAFTNDGKTIHFFEGKLKGQIVKPRGSRKFGWDSIFQALGQQKTFGEMSTEGKNHISPRAKAATEFKKFLRLQAKRR